MESQITERSLSKKVLKASFTTCAAWLFLLALPTQPTQGLLAPPSEFYEGYEPYGGYETHEPYGGYELNGDCGILGSACWNRNTQHSIDINNRNAAMDSRNTQHSIDINNRNAGVTARNNKVTSDYRAALAALAFDGLGLWSAAIKMKDLIDKQTMPAINTFINNAGPKISALSAALDGSKDIAETLKKVSENLSVLTELTPLIEQLKKVMEIAPGIVTPLTGFGFNVGNTFGLNPWSPKKEWGANLAAASMTTRTVLNEYVIKRILPLLERANHQLLRTVPTIQESIGKIAVIAAKFGPLLKLA
ncbi:TPA: hypothetical protein DDZ86_04500 [Candidatus Dependentiae bacterium]|nr:MAG: hypothetical protein UW09_C0002G0131 [candidate division TM6 bacterium GW2011_GWF2_43_87]HBL98873.1 hypothetical protein [Candidatus Dependentiae bacterium]